ncbi:hypothetical protein C8R42DRAFT_651800 [Lentinula raphanica]|nr:hypothetical protein C8R42DRAFT_651800 [Lentinula raphanica]
MSSSYLRIPLCLFFNGEFSPLVSTLFLLLIHRTRLAIAVSSSKFAHILPPLAAKSPCHFHIIPHPLIIRLPSLNQSSRIIDNHPSTC